MPRENALAYDCIVLVLDLDETLIYAAEQPLERPADWRLRPYSVYYRPYLAEFLAAIAQSFALAVWSSGTIDYVEAIVARIMPSGIEPALVWGRVRCTRRLDPELREEYWVKDLKKIKRQGYSLDPVLIIEDTPKKVERHYGIAIYIKSYYGAADDDELRMLGSYLASICDAPNVRRLEKRNWRAAQ